MKIRNKQPILVDEEDHKEVKVRAAQSGLPAYKWMKKFLKKTKGMEVIDDETYF